MKEHDFIFRLLLVEILENRKAGVADNVWALDEIARLAN
jgi:hypothetical protein